MSPPWGDMFNIGFYKEKHEKSYFLKSQDLKGCALSTIASKDISKTTGWILSKIGRNDSHMALYKIIQMVTFDCKSKSHRLK